MHYFVQSLRQLSKIILTFVGEEIETPRGSVYFPKPKSRYVVKTGLKPYDLEEEESWSLPESFEKSIKLHAGRERPMQPETFPCRSGTEYSFSGCG